MAVARSAGRDPSAALCAVSVEFDGKAWPCVAIAVSCGKLACPASAAAYRTASERSSAMGIENIMYFVLGLLVAGLIALIIMPAVWRRAVRLTKKRIEAATPMTMAEFRADKDQLRAEFALSTSRLEMNVEALRRRLADQLRDINRKKSELGGIKGERDTHLDSGPRTRRARRRTPPPRPRTRKGKRRPHPEIAHARPGVRRKVRQLDAAREAIRTTAPRAYRPRRQVAQRRLQRRHRRACSSISTSSASAPAFSKTRTAPSSPSSKVRTNALPKRGSSRRLP